MRNRDRRSTTRCSVGVATVCAVVMMACPWPAASQEILWGDCLSGVTANSFMTMSPDLFSATAGMRITAPGFTQGDVLIPLQSSGDRMIDSVLVCYEAGASSSITLTQLSTLSTPPHIPLASNGTSHPGGAPSCYAVDVPNQVATGTLWLRLTVNVAPSPGFVELYAVGLKLLPSATSVQSSDGAGAPELGNLKQNEPNPFAASTTIRYRLEKPSRTSVRIFDVAGRQIRELRAGLQGAGDYVETWDGRDENGRPVGSGVYFYQLQTESGVEAKQAVMIR